MHTDRCHNTCGQTYHAKGSRSQIKVQEIMYIDTTNVRNEMYDYTGKNKATRIVTNCLEKNLKPCKENIQ
jgi:hypothetical protein